jgi:SPP1 gp7 family putative phage head morphogenesis protein
MKKSPRWLYPKTAELRYRKVLHAVVALWKKSVKDTLPQLEPMTGVREDDTADNVERIMGHLKMSMNSAVHPVALKVQLLDIGQRTSKWNDKQWRKTMKSVLGVDTHSPDKWLGSHIKSFVSENTQLITKLNSEVYTRVNTVVETGIRKGISYKTLREEILTASDISESRANLIARDQIGKLNGELTQLRQSDAGIKKYIWRTAGDERVRGEPDGLYPDSDPSHYDREGKIFSWDNPPEGGHPGEAIQCRCTAEPVFEEAEFNDHGGDE